jgi:hypothetical protein
MSVVYRAEHVRLGRRAALKLLAPGLGEADFSVRFLRESKLAASPPLAAQQLQRDLGTVRRFLLRAGIDASAISPSVVSTETEVEKLPHHDSSIR